MELTKEQIEDSLPHIRRAFMHLFKMWDAMGDVELFIGKEISTSDLTDNSLAVCEIEEITDDYLRDFLKEL